MTNIPEFIRSNPSITEQELAWEIEKLLRAGVYDLSFPVIVAFGANSSRPHHQPTSLKLTPDTNILIDCGVRSNGWCTDITRNYWFGSPSTEDFHAFKQKYELLLRAQLQATAMMREGTLPSEIDSTCRRELGDQARFFTHSLGHGIGLEVHEAPSLLQSNTTPLRAGTIVTNEPGLYYQDQFGIRIEDMIVVDAKTPKVLTNASRELVVIEN